MVRTIVGLSVLLVCTRAGAQDGAPPQAPPAPEGQPAEPAPAPPQEKHWSEGWSGSVDLGITGAEGNTTNFNFRGAVGARRTTDFFDTKLSFVYSFKSDDGNDTENKAVFDARNDWLFRDSPWRLFVLGSLEYDQFKDYDLRLSLFAGAGYEIIKDDATLLVGRLGAGVSREFGGSDDTWTPEALLGADFERKVAPNQKVFATVDLFPSLDDFPAYRFNAKAGYEILLDEQSKLLLKLGIEDQYDSTPGDGFHRNDLTYFVTLGWAF